MPGPEILALLIPLAAVVGGISLAILGMFSSHQRKMAEIMQRNAGPEVDELTHEVRKLRVEVAQLKTRIGDREQFERRLAQEELDREIIPPPYTV